MKSRRSGAGPPAGHARRQNRWLISSTRQSRAPLKPPAWPRGWGTAPGVTAPNWSRTGRTSVTGPSRFGSCQDRLDHVPVDVGQAVVAAGVAVGEFLVV